MPPKRKAAAGAAKGGKKAKKEAPAPATPQNMKDAAAVLKAEDKKGGGKKSHKKDSYCPLGIFAQVYDDYDCMLNQTNIGHNNNKYYVIQVLEQGGSYYAWNRWGRVGEAGANSLKGPTDLASAVKDFEKKFKDKTKNNWANRASFNPVKGKYTLIEMADEDETDAPVASTSIAAVSGKKTAESKLDATTQKLLKLLFDNDMFKDCMKKFDIDVKKMPLGKLSKGQIAKGFEVLDEIEKVLDKKSKASLAELSSKFYTVIPHDFGRRIPPVINDIEMLRTKMDMLLVLGDIEIAQSMKKEKDKKMEAEKGDLLPNPIDVEYGLLSCDLELVDKKSKEFKIIDTYTKNTTGGWRTAKIKDVWKVGRIGEDKRFKEHDKITNRKLLWHGTNVAVVAAILKSGLRIMPHSGGRVGAGIYFASENSKSAGYVGTIGKTGIMFLNEVALGKEKHVDTNQSHLKAAPAGYDCVIAQGNTEPDPKQNTSLSIDGKKVVVPQGKAINNPGWSHSHFSQNPKQNTSLSIDGKKVVVPQGKAINNPGWAHSRFSQNPKQNTSLSIDGKKVVVPQGKAINNPGWAHSRFSQSEYLIYKESQNRIRYLLLMDF